MKTRQMLMMMAIARRSQKETSMASRIFGLILMLTSACIAIVCGVILVSGVLIGIGIVTLIAAGMLIAHRIRKNRYRW